VLHLTLLVIGCAWYRNAKFYECAVTAAGMVLFPYSMIVEDLKSIQDGEGQAATSKIARNLRSRTP